MNHNPLDLPAGGESAKSHQEFSFDLDDRIIETLASECDPKKMIAEFAEALKGDKDKEAISRDIFKRYGQNWMIRTLELSDQYPDRTYEVLKEAAQKTGALTFPHIPQRAIEIAYTSTKGIYEMPIVENNPQRLVYKMINCSTYQNLIEVCGHDVAKTLPCRYACLSACETLKQELGLAIEIVMEASTPEDGFCQFAMNK
jgi:hypothetical protein